MKAQNRLPANTLWQFQNLISPAVVIRPDFPIVVRKHWENYCFSLIARTNSGEMECYHIAVSNTRADINRCITSDYQWGHFHIDFSVPVECKRPGSYLEIECF